VGHPVFCGPTADIPNIKDGGSGTAGLKPLIHFI